MSTTYRHALDEAYAMPLDRLEAQLLLLHVLGKTSQDRAWLHAHDDEQFAPDVAKVFSQYISRRAEGEPLAYIVGHKEFFGLHFNVDPHVLIPRADTETLVSWALDVLAGLPGPKILDLGTGSGVVAISIAASLGQKSTVTAIDASQEALLIAAQNALHLGVDVKFLRSRWFENVSGQHHAIVSNPPYIASGDKHLADLKHEPLSALSAGVDGLDDIRQIVKDSPLFLGRGGWLLLEHGYDQASAVRQLLGQRGFSQVQSRQDLAGIERCSGGQWGSSKSRDNQV